MMKKSMFEVSLLSRLVAVCDCVRSTEYVLGSLISDNRQGDGRHQNLRHVRARNRGSSTRVFGRTDLDVGGRLTIPHRSPLEQKDKQKHVARKDEEVRERKQKVRHE